MIIIPTHLVFYILLLVMKHCSQFYFSSGCWNIFWLINSFKRANANSPKQRLAKPSSAYYKTLLFSFRQVPWEEMTESTSVQWGARLAHIGSLYYSLHSPCTWVESHQQKMWHAVHVNQRSESRPRRHCIYSAILYWAPPPTPCDGFVYTATAVYSLCRTIPYPIFKKAETSSQPQRRPVCSSL